MALTFAALLYTSGNNVALANYSYVCLDKMCSYSKHDYKIVNPTSGNCTLVWTFTAIIMNYSTQGATSAKTLTIANLFSACA